MADLENYGRLKYKSLEAKVRVEIMNGYESESYLLSKFKEVDREEEVYMFQGALEMDHRGTSCLTRGGDQCRIKEDGKFNFIQVRLTLRR